MSTRRSFTVRPAASRDAAAVLALVPRLRAFEPPSTFRPPAALDAGEQRTLRRFFDGNPAGACLWVAEDAEGRGVGKALLATVEQWSRDAGFRFLSLNVFADNTRAIGVYEKAGYRADFVRYVKPLL